jgi:hypothetical protein
MTKTKTTFSSTIDFLKDCDTVIFEHEGAELVGEVTLHDPEIHEDDCPEGHVYIIFSAIEGREEFPFGMPVHEDDIVEIVPEDDPRHLSNSY